MCLEPLCLFTSLFGICLSLYWIISSNEQICHFFCSLPKSLPPFKPLFLLKLPPRLCFYLQQNSMKVLLTFISSFSLPIVLFFLDSFPSRLCPYHSAVTSDLHAARCNDIFSPHLTRAICLWSPPEDTFFPGPPGLTSSQSSWLGFPLLPTLLTLEATELTPWSSLSSLSSGPFTSLACTSSWNAKFWSNCLILGA